MGRKSFLFQLAAALIVTGLMLFGGVANAVTDDAAQTTNAAQYEESGGGCGNRGGGCGGQQQHTPAAYEEPPPPPSDPPPPVAGAALSVDPTTLPTKTTEGGSETGGGGGGGGGSCPYLYVWNGGSYVRDNDIIPFKSSTEGTDYYRIQQPLKPEDGYYKVRIAEELPETSYLDYFRLMTVDYPANIDVYPDINGNLFNISNPKPPISCVDSYGNDRLGLIKGREQVYTNGTYFEGKPGDYLIVNFGNLAGAKIIKLVMTTDTGKSILIDAAVQTQNSDSKWETKIVFSTHEFWATNVFDVTGMMPDANGDYKLRFYFTDTHKIDCIAIDTTPEVAKEVHILSPGYASGQDVLTRVAEADGRYTVMTRGDELFLKFPAQPASAQSNFKRDFIFVSKGFYIRTGQ